MSRKPANVWNLFLTCVKQIIQNYFLLFIFTSRFLTILTACFLFFPSHKFQKKKTPFQISTWFAKKIVILKTYRFWPLASFNSPSMRDWIQFSIKFSFSYGIIIALIYWSKLAEKRRPSPHGTIQRCLYQFVQGGTFDQSLFRECFQNFCRAA